MTIFTNLRKALLSGAGVLAAAGLSAGIGLALTPAHADTAWQPEVATYAPSSVPVGLWHPLSREAAYEAYVAAYGITGGCREGIDAAYQGTQFISDLPKGLRDDLVEQLSQGEGPAVADYLDGAVITVPDDPTQVIVLGEYEGRC